MKERIKKRGGMLLCVPFALAGVCGVLLPLRGLAGISCAVWGPVCAAGALLFALQCALYYGRNWSWRLALACAAALAAAGWILRGALSVQALRVWEALAGKVSDGAVRPVNLLAVFAGCALALFFFCSEVLLSNHLLPAAMVTAALLGLPRFGVQTGWAAVAAAACFLAGFQLYQTHRQGEGASEKLPRSDAAALGLALAVTLGFGALGSLAAGSRLSGLVYGAEGFVYRSVKNLTGRAALPEEDGRISRGNRYRTGAEQLLVTVSRPISEPLYLMDFVGERYEDGVWTPADDEAMINQAAEEMGWFRWNTMLSDMYGNMYFIMNSALNSSDTSRLRELSIRHVSGDYRVRYTPYYSYSRNRAAVREDGYRYSYYEQRDIRIDWDDVREDFRMGGVWYRQLQEAYQHAVLPVCTETPKDRIPRLAALCREHPLTELDDITAFILWTLDTRADYTLTPGWTPAGKESAEYFLFESGEGYCEQFALCATLMYRLYGIPARYAAGYRVDPEDFEQQEDGTYLARVTDESAHAWPEIFLMDYGWVPVEVTPSEDAPVSYPGFDGEKLRELIRLHGWTQEESAASGGEEDLPLFAAQPESERAPGAPAGIGAAVRLPAGADGVRLVAALFLAFLALLFCLRERSRRRFRRMGVRELYTRFLGMLSAARRSPRCGEGDEEYPGQLAALLPGVPVGEVRRMYALVCAAAYGPPGTADSEEDVRFMREFCAAAYRSLAAKAPFFARLRLLRFRPR